MIRTSDPAIVIPAVRNLVHQLNPDLPILNVASMRDIASFGIMPQTIAAWLASVMGWLSLMLAAIRLWRHSLCRELADS